ncbi:MAG: hypothetical protein SGCHY_004089 [Lobulomycetales sp.]
MEGSSGLTEEDLALPKATIAKIISELLPEDLSIARDTRDLISDCCVEFIHLVSSEANEISEKESKKTISGDHVVSALKSLGFDGFIDEINATLSEHGQQEKERQTRKKKADPGISVEEQMRLQEELFANAKARMQQGASSASAPADKNEEDE